LCEDGLYGLFCDFRCVIGNDGANEFYEEINIVDATSEIEAPVCKTERLAAPTVEELILAARIFVSLNLGAS
jgi:hypothetical protein